MTIITIDVRGGGSGVLESVRSTARDAFAPVQTAADKVFSPVGDFFGGITRYGHLKSENARLRRQLADARGASNTARDAIRERQDLLRQENLSFASDIKTVPARVVASSTSIFEFTLQIDRCSHSSLAN